MAILIDYRPGKMKWKDPQVKANAQFFQSTPSKIVGDRTFLFPNSILQCQGSSLKISAKSLTSSNVQSFMAIMLSQQLEINDGSTTFHGLIHT